MIYLHMIEIYITIPHSIIRQEQAAYDTLMTIESLLDSSPFLSLIIGAQGTCTQAPARLAHPPVTLGAVV